VRRDRSLTAWLTWTTAPVALCRIGGGAAALGRSLKDARDLYLIPHDSSVVPAPMFAWSPVFLMTLLLTFVESDAALSVRALLGHGRPQVIYWPVLLMKIQVSLVYFFAAVAKLNPVFLSGALWIPRLRLVAIAIGVVMHALVPIVFGMYAGLIVFNLATISIYPLFFATPRRTSHA
jgi:hypothetical protein